MSHNVIGGMIGIDVVIGIGIVITVEEGTDIVVMMTILPVVETILVVGMIVMMIIVIAVEAHQGIDMMVTVVEGAVHAVLHTVTEAAVAPPGEMAEEIVMILTGVEEVADMMATAVVEGATVGVTIVMEDVMLGGDAVVKGVTGMIEAVTGAKGIIAMTTPVDTSRVLISCG